MMKKGFTLVEMLVVVAVLTVAGIVLTEVFIRNLRGSNKTQLVGTIKQNGQAALEVMDKTIRGSGAISCISSEVTGKTLVVESKTDINNQVITPRYTRFRFVVNDSGVGTGTIQQDFPTDYSTTSCEFSDPLLSPLTLTDTNTLTGVSVIQSNIDGVPQPFFKLNELSGFNDVVTINFSLKPGIGAPSVVAGQIDPVSFSTTVELR